MPLKVIIPKSLALDLKRMQRAIENGLDASAKAAKVDFGVTTQTWQQQPEFSITETANGRAIGTDDEVYGYVNDGTRPHLIVAKGKALAFGVPSSPKTAPRVIGSSAGSRGNTPVRVKFVRHPGTDAREFAETIAKKWRELLPRTMQRSIDAEVS
jgi:hypothetical protein